MSFSLSEEYLFAVHYSSIVCRLQQIQTRCPLLPVYDRKPVAGIHLLCQYHLTTDISQLQHQVTAKHLFTSDQHLLIGRIGEGIVCLLMVPVPVLEEGRFNRRYHPDEIDENHHFIIAGKSKPDRRRAIIDITLPHE